MASLVKIHSSVDPAALNPKKLTSLGLYVSTADAAAALKANPGIVFIDVRTPQEVAAIGRPAPVDAIVPLVQFSQGEIDPDTGHPPAVPNPDFIAGVEAEVARAGGDKASPVFVMCRSGGRSAMAANALAKAGFSNVWSLVEGFEGDADAEGKRTVNGWRNAGLEWNNDTFAHASGSAKQ